MKNTGLGVSSRFLRFSSFSSFRSALLPLSVRQPSNVGEEVSPLMPPSHCVNLLISFRFLVLKRMFYFLAQMRVNSTMESQPLPPPP